MKKQSLRLAIACIVIATLSIQDLNAFELNGTTDVVNMVSENEIEKTNEEKLEGSLSDQSGENQELVDNTNDVYEESIDFGAYSDEISIPLKGTTIQNVQVGELGTSTYNPTNSVIYMYLFEGESLDIEVIKDVDLGRSSTKGILKVIDMDGVVVSRGEFDGSNFDPIRLHVPATQSKTGLYTLVYESVSSSRSGTGSDLTFQIKNNEGSIQSGRVFSKKLAFEQSGKLIDYQNNRRFSDTLDFTLFHRSSDGYLYQQELFGFNGIISTITSDPIGIVNNETCEQLKYDTRAYNAKYPALIFDEEIQNKCNLEVESNNIFLDMPDIKLPAKAYNSFGDLIIVNPKLEEMKQSFSEVTYDKKSKYEQGGYFTFTGENIQNYVDVTILVSQNGTGNDLKQIKKQVWLSAKNPKAEIYWDGTYEDGTKVPNYAKVSVEVELKKAGEIHFVLEDVEARKGMSVTRLEGYTQEHKNRLFYNSDSDYYPIDRDIAPGFYGQEIGEGSYDSKMNPSFRGWDYEQPIVSQDGNASFQGTWTPIKKDSPLIVYREEAVSDNELLDEKSNFRSEKVPVGYYYGYQDYSMGDGSYINDWTYEDISIKQQSEFVVEKSQLSLEMYGIDVNSTGQVQKGEDVFYKIKVSNNGTGFARDVVIKDTLEDIQKYIEDPTNNVVTIMNGGESINYTVSDLMKGIIIPIIDAGDSLELSFVVRTLSKLPSNANKKDFNNDVIMKASCDVEDVVNSCSEVKVSSRLKIKSPAKPGIVVDYNSSVNGVDGALTPDGKLVSSNGESFNASSNGHNNGSYFGNGWYLSSNGVLTSVFISDHIGISALSLAVMSAIVIGKKKRERR